MATLFVTEYATLGQVSGHQPMPQEPPLADYSISVTGSSQQSQAFNSKTRVLRLKTDSTGAVCVAVSSNPTAAVGAGHMSASQTEYRGVPEGGSFKVAVINATNP